MSHEHTLQPIGLERPVNIETDDLELVTRIGVIAVRWSGDDLTPPETAYVTTQARKAGDDPAHDEARTRANLDHGHLSVFDQNTVTFAIHNLPVVVEREQLRHTGLRYAAASSRVLRMDQRPFFVPAMIREAGPAVAYQYEPLDEEAAVKIMEEMARAYHDCLVSYRRLRAMGLARTSARYVLPMATTLPYHIGGNLRNWFHYLVLRTAEGVEPPLRDMALQIQWLLESIWPRTMRIWSELGKPDVESAVKGRDLGWCAMELAERAIMATREEHESAFYAEAIEKMRGLGYE